MSMYNLSKEKTRLLTCVLEKSRRDHIIWLSLFTKQLICIDANCSAKMTHKDCDFGKFYYAVTEDILLNNKVFRDIEITHRKLHDIANKIIAIHENNQPITAEDYDLFVSINLKFTCEQDAIYSFIQEAHHSMDKLTQLPNKGFMMSILDKEYNKLKRAEKESSLVFADIDHFKKINDLYGHASGDIVLQEISKILLMDLREYDIVSRFGGEEFLFFIYDASPQTTKKIMERVRRNISKMKFLLQNNEVVNITCSFGISAFTLNDSLEQIMRKADVALYSAKNKGRDRVEIYATELK